MPGKQRYLRSIDIPKAGAFDAGGDAASTAAIVPPSQTSIGPPTNLVLTTAIERNAVTPTAQIGATWYPPAGVAPSSYVVQWSTSASFPDPGTNGQGATAEATTLSGLTPATLYYVRVVAVAGNQTSQASATASITTAADTSPPNPPTYTGYIWGTTSDLTITWINPASANFRDVQIGIYADSSKAVTYALLDNATGRVVWTAADNLVATGGVGDPSVWVEMRSRSWGGVFSTTVVVGGVGKAAPAAPTVTVDFTGPDAVFTITPPIDAVTLSFVADTSVTARRIALVGRYVYTFDQNRLDHSGTPDPSLAYSFTVIDGINQASSATSGTATNAAPSPPSAVTATGFFSMLSVALTVTPPSDFLTYRYRIIQTLPSAADVTFDSPSTLVTRGVASSATYQVGVKVMDVFGQLSTEALSATTITDGITLAQLRARIVYSDAVGTAADYLKTWLAEGDVNSSGANYASAAGWTQWIAADWLLQERIRTITLSLLPVSGTTNWYVRLSKDAVTWSYFSGPPVTTGASGPATTLTAVASAAAAQASAVNSASLGLPAYSRIDLPTLQEARYIELWFRNTTAVTGVAEFFPRRLVQSDDGEFESIKTINIAVGAVIADRISVAQLSAIQANMGTLHMDGVIDIAAAGGIYQGSGTFASPTTGLKLFNSGGVGKLSGYNAGVEQVTLGTDGKLKAGAGAVILDATGLATYNAGVWQVAVGTNGQLKAGAGAVVLDATGLATYNGGAWQVAVGTDGKVKAGGGAVVLDATGFVLDNAGSAPSTFAQMRFQKSAVDRATMGYYDDGSYSFLDIRMVPVTGRQSVIGLIADPFGSTGTGSVSLESSNGPYVAMLKATYSNTVTLIEAYGDQTIVYGGLGVGTSGSSAGQISTSAGIGVGIAANTTVRVYAKGSGTTSATGTIYTVNSAATLEHYVLDNGAGFINAAAWTYSSDERLKEQITKSDRGLEHLKQIEAKRFDYKDGSKNQMGFLAAEVQAIMPELVVPIDPNDTSAEPMLGMLTTNLIPVLVSAVQELDARLAALEEKK